MNRSIFLKQILAAAGGLGLTHSLSAAPDDAVRKYIRQPPFLKAGDIIGITCPASPIEMTDMLYCKQSLQNWGFNVCVGNTVGQHWQRFGGSDAERASDLQLMLNDPSIKAIIFARGGYGAMRMMDSIDWSALKQHPKWLIGYSDITAIHCHVQTMYGIPTIHGDMVNGFRATEDESTRSLKKLLTGERLTYTAPSSEYNRNGQAGGILVGGNLSLVAAMLGSKSSLQTAGKILLLEEVSEYKYTLDRMLISLKRAGLFQNLAGLIIGGITATKTDSETPFPASIEEIIVSKVAGYDYPVGFNFPAGHISNNLAMKLGVYYNLVVGKHGSQLNELHPMNPLFPQPIITDTLEMKF